MLRVFNIPVSVDKVDTPLKQIVSEFLNIPENYLKEATLYKKSVDARNKNNVHFIFCTNITSDKENRILENNKGKKIEKVCKYKYEIKSCINLTKRPIVVGFGPAGIFAALSFAEAGQSPIVIERGSCVEKRTIDVNKFWNVGELNTESNVQFGEGGAGTFSDGKLNTGTKDIRSRKVLEEFVKLGAPEEILYNSKPHVGTDNLKMVIKNIRKRIVSLGGEVRFNTKLIDIVTVNEKIKGIVVENNHGIEKIETDNVILAIGHSARDTFELLFRKNIQLEPKNFSVGIRIEHLQEEINRSQYGSFSMHNALGAAEYKLAVHLKTGRSVYTFCMCPGGKVVSAVSEPNTVVTNGMSEFSRSEKNSNSAVLVGITPNDFQNNHPLAGVNFQRDIERKAFTLAGGNYNAPAQCFKDFLDGRVPTSFGKIIPSYKPGVTPCDLSEIFPDYVAESLRKGIIQMNNRLKNFAAPESILTGPETRSSSPIRILRNNCQQSVSLKGLYPCGEGSGYAGGIISAAVDGIRCAESVMGLYNK